jgi:hypothetical protein
VKKIRVAFRFRARIGLWTCLLSAAASCGGGGGGSSLVVAGTVRSPGGQAIAFAATRPSHVRAASRGPGRELELAGLLPVPDGTAVDLVRLDDLGEVVETVASSTTVSGRYAFDLSSLRLSLASDLAVTAGSGVSRMRALAAQRALDVDPVSEAVVFSILEQGRGLAPFTVQEASDLETAAGILVVTTGLSAQADVPSTVALVEQALLAESALSSFLTSAAQDGQTSEGPGDVGDYFPSSSADTWAYAGRHTSTPSLSEDFEHARRVTGIDKDGVQTVEETNSFDAGEPVHDFLAETSTGLVERGDDDPTDPLGHVAPFDAARFPLRAGESWVQFDVHGLSAGDDLDGDGTFDTLDVRSVREFVQFEDLSASTGAFDNCARFDTNAVTTLILSAGGRAKSTLSSHEWFAPGLGLVRSQEDIVTTFLGQTQHDAFVEALASYQVGENGRGILPAHALADDLNAWPRLGFDGTNYLCVASRQLFNSAELVGSLVTQRGVVLQQFPILETGDQRDQRPAMAFDGSNHLLVFNSPDADAHLVGVRISPQGDVLDPSGFMLAASAGSRARPAVAFDGVNFLVVWSQIDGVLASEIHAAFVTPAGSVGSEFTVQSASGDQGFPAIVFGANQYLVVWVDQQGSSAKIRGARVTTDGNVLDPAGFDVTAGVDFNPVLSFDGDRYLVAWTRTPAGFTGADVWAARLEPDGTPSDPAPIQISSGEVSVTPTVAFDGTDHFVAWETVAPFGIHAARISPAGVLLDGPPSSMGLTLDANGIGLHRPGIVRGSRNTLLAWIGDVGNGQIRATLSYPSGSP